MVVGETRELTRPAVGEKNRCRCARTSGEENAVTRAVEVEGDEEAGCSREDGDIALRPVMLYVDAVIDRRARISTTNYVEQSGRT